ncbi:MAG TPA: hypothetical protein VMO78_08670, partial [Rhizomicrobium sp.]|nr:hypothetical protein [Rhizomicrobium sp.]
MYISRPVFLRAIAFTVRSASVTLRSFKRKENSSQYRSNQMRRSYASSRDLPTQRPRNPDVVFLECIAALAEKRSSLLQEEAKIWSQASLAF